MRGKVLSAPTVTLPSGITPAHAGKSYLCCGMVLPGWDHPRTCGEKWAGESLGKQGRGSPPHMRGKAPTGYASSATSGITPAHAGKRKYAPSMDAYWWDHPRTCGEKLLTSLTACVPAGSPPHMRGKVSRTAYLGLLDGITPAHAGKSVQLNISAIAIRDHPRTCGEKSAITAHAVPMTGSPPHMRGKDVAYKFAGKCHGITPAHAGKSGPGNPWGSKDGDHPRTCGEKDFVFCSNSEKLGSPPHMRGKAFFTRLPVPCAGITPAHAGKRCE